jgi:hypothetical protein
LSNNGLTTPITISANTNLFAPGNVSYNSGSVDFGSFGTFVILANDPHFQGGSSAIYSIATLLSSQVNSDGNIVVGKITIANGSTSTSGGNTGGSQGSSGIGGRGLVL